MLKKNIFHTAPATHKTVPNIPTSTAIQAAFDPTDHPFKPPKQSVSEEQSYAHVMPIHGVKIWQSLASYVIFHYLLCCWQDVIDLLTPL